MVSCKITLFRVSFRFSGFSKARAVHKFGVSLRLRMMVCMVSRVKQSIWKGFRSMEQDLESFGLRLKNWL